MNRLIRPPARSGLGALSAELARAFGDRPALVDEGGVVLTFSQLHRRAQLVACTLIALHDLRKGERVLIPAGPGEEGLTALLGTAMAGGIAVPWDAGAEGEASACAPRLGAARICWERGCRLLEEMPGGVFTPYTRKPDELAALCYAEGEGSRGVMVSDRSLAAAGLPLALALRVLGVRAARLTVPLNRPAGLAWALACLGAGVALGPGRGASALLGEVPGEAGAVEGCRLRVHPGMLEDRAPAGSDWFLDGPCFDEACGFVLLRLRRGGDPPPPLLWPLPRMRYRVAPGEGTLSVRGKALAFGYWGELEESLRRLGGGWFETGMRVRRRGPAFSRR